MAAGAERAWSLGRVVARAGAAPAPPPMDGLPEFAQPQLLAGLLAIALLSLALGLETVMVWTGLRRSAAPLAQHPLAQPPHAQHPLAPDTHPLGHDFYDWLYE